MLKLYDEINFLKVISIPFYKEVGKNRTKTYYVNTLCKCGKEKIIKERSVRIGEIKSCGCYNKKVSSERIKIYNKQFQHGLLKHDLYYKWRYIINNIKRNNIDIISEWKNDFMSFYNWSINNGWCKGKVLTRKDTNLGYFPENCVFVTDKELSNKSESIEKRKKTCIKKFGSEYPSQSEIIKNKIKSTCLIKYGVGSVFQVPEIREKGRKTTIQKYGTLAIKSKGLQQKSVLDWLSTIGYIFQNNISLPLINEIDLYNEQLKLGIEYCGTHWHTEKFGRFKNYHINKLKECNKLGIRLITIFSDEWLFRQNQCKNYIKSVLNIFDRRVYGRLCEVKLINNDIAIPFIQDNHIQGVKRKAVIYFGLFLKNELLGVISLNKHPRGKDITVLDRLCFKGGVNILGGASKLFKRCIDWAKSQKIDKIISWSDNRWSEGNIYKILGFELEKQLLPDYQYVELNGKIRRISKQSCQKKKIKCPLEKTENEFMKEKGYSRIWDCGKKRWVFKIK